MKIYPFLIAITALWPFLPGPAAALDNKALEEHLRESYNFPAHVQIEIGSLEPSEVPGFDKAPVTLSMGKAAQKENLYISKNGRHYMLGKFRDLQDNPDQERLKKMDLKDAPVRGKPKAPVLVVEYTDFQCPFCQKGYEIMRNQIMKEYPSQVRWFYKALPLNSIHPWAQPAAIAVECAKLQSQQKFWALHDIIFDKQGEIRASNADEKLLALAKSSGIEPKAFSACYDSQKTLPTVQRDLAEAENLGVNGTPAFLINGHLVGGADYTQLKQVIEEALKGRHGRP